MAGSSMKSIKLRIKSVQSTMQITHAMQLVATSKLRRSKERMEQSKSYAGIAGEAVKAVLSACKDEHIAFAQKREVKKRCYVIIAGERGLAGGYNNNIFKAVQAMDDGTPYCVLPIGRKAIEKYQHLGVELLNTEHAHVEGLPVGACFTLARMLAEGYEKGDFDELILVHTSFINMMSQEVVSDRLLPVEQPESKDPRLVSTVFDPNPEETLKSIIRRLPATLLPARYPPAATRWIPPPKMPAK